MNYFFGIDIGSSTIKVAVIDSNRQLIASEITPTGSMFKKNSHEALEKIIHEFHIPRENISSIISTGYGRKLINESNDTISEISANVLGVKFFITNSIKVRTIINIGGQDSKLINISDDFLIKNFGMNDKCAAGTGRFLEIIARILELDIDELGDMHFQGKDNYPVINSTCAVFAESEIISLLAKGRTKAQIVAGVHYSIAKKILRLSTKNKIEHPVVFDGGAALNKGLKDAIEDEIMNDVIVFEDPQITTAVGAALKAFENSFNKTN